MDSNTDVYIYFFQVSPVLELTQYYAYSYRDGPRADEDIQGFSKCTHLVGKIRNVYFEPMSIFHFKQVVDNYFPYRTANCLKKNDTIRNQIGFL